MEREARAGGWARHVRRRAIKRWQTRQPSPDLRARRYCSLPGLKIAPGEPGTGSGEADGTEARGRAASSAVKVRRLRMQRLRSLPIGKVPGVRLRQPPPESAGRSTVPGLSMRSRPGHCRVPRVPEREVFARSSGITQMSAQGQVWWRASLARLSSADRGDTGRGRWAGRPGVGPVCG